MAAEPPRASNETAIAEAIQRVSANTQALVRDELELAKLEVKRKVTNVGRGAAIAAAAGIFALAALALILHGIAWLLWYLVFPRDEFFWGFFMEAVILLVLAGVAGLVAAKLLKKAQPPVPDQAIEQAKITQATISKEASRIKDEVREVDVKPEDKRS